MKTEKECREIMARAGDPGAPETHAEAIVHRIWFHWSNATDNLTNRPKQNLAVFSAVAIPILLEVLGGKS